MKFTTQYISDMLSCARSKLAAASTVSWKREYYGLYGLTDSLQHIYQLKLYIFLINRFSNSPSATNATTEQHLSCMFDHIIRMPYSCDLMIESQSSATENRPPAVNAGADQSLSAATTSTTLAGTVSDPDGDTVTVLWTKVSGGNVTINSSTGLITTLTNMQPGIYVFRLTATDSNGASAYDDVTVTIAQALDKIYYGRIDDGLSLVGLGNYINTNGTQLNVNGALDISIPWHTGATHPQYCWAAIPDLGVAYQKNHWFVDIINQGNIGLETDLFMELTNVNILGVDYIVLQTNYQTQFSAICKLQKL